MIDLPDLALIKRFKEGDEAAFDHLFQRYKYLIAKIARKYYVRGYETEDFYQTGAIAFYKAVLTFEEKEDSTFYSYILTCIRNKIVSQFRKQCLRVEYATDLDDIAKVMESSAMYTVKKSKILEEENGTLLHTYRTELENLLSDDTFLSQLEKKCLEGFARGFSYAEIAESYGIEIKQVDNALMRIRSKVKNVI